ncbi:relaxase/mobilization nuclease domain-containing protein [Mucilaginibacter sp. dw_454]|uniref:relaxase/mobilization nuclease domain-containing protein n=1 Tax=Mucilaginibacter sp. dw_454 TaxID=2720079 RepID=UPI001BD5C9F7|nr:relaxase/mobilization nuclease domain-containing protein [Mucilaginibacter sp. dw_454]
MVAKIITGKTIRGIVNYNENKVKQGHAQCIAAGNYGVEENDLSFYQKLNRLEHLQEKNSRVKTNAVHISLNFDPSEKLTKTQLSEVGASYMEKIGFGDQPYLIYQHLDAGHPHIHIVTTNVQTNGQAISLHNIGRERSEPARKELELEYGLVQAESRSQKQQQQTLKPFSIEKLQYGQTETKRAITNIVNTIIKQYNFTSLPELNAVLKQYNVMADRGAEDTRMFQKNGLLYSATDDQGNKLGVAIKASAIYNKPTLKNLEQRFQKNGQSRKLYSEMLKERIDNVLSNHPRFSRNDLDYLLKKENIKLLYRENKDGLIYGITFIDQFRKSVFNGSDLGKNYAAKALTARMMKEDQYQHEEFKQRQKQGEGQPVQQSTKTNYNRPLSIDRHEPLRQTNNILSDLLQTRRLDDHLPGQLKKKRKRKRKQGQQQRNY